MKKNKIKNLLHQKHQKQYEQHVESWLAKTKPIKTQADTFGEFGYYPDMSPDQLNHNYGTVVEPIIKKIQNSEFHYNEKDNRTLLADLNYVEAEKGYKFFTGLVVDYRIVDKKPDKPAKLYVLLASIYTLIHGGTGKYRYRACTDHLWIDINRFYADINNDKSQITLGIGDLVHFTAQLTTYRGSREGIRQTKYGVKNVIIEHSGYPLVHIVRTNKDLDSGRAAVSLSASIPYSHKHHFLIQYQSSNVPNKINYILGDQIKPHDYAKLITNRKFKVGERKGLPMYMANKSFMLKNDPVKEIGDPETTNE